MYIIPLYQSNVRIQFRQCSCEFNTINSYKFPHTLACKSVTSFETHLLRTGLFSQPFLPHFQEAKAEIEEHIFKNCNYTCFNEVHYKIKYQLIINEDFNQNHILYMVKCLLHIYFSLIRQLSKFAKFSMLKIVIFGFTTMLNLENLQTLICQKYAKS